MREPFRSRCRRNPSGATSSAASTCSRTSWTGDVCILITRYPCPAARCTSAANSAGDACRVQAATETASLTFGPISRYAGTPRCLPITSYRAPPTAGSKSLPMNSKGLRPTSGSTLAAEGAPPRWSP